MASHKCDSLASGHLTIVILGRLLVEMLLVVELFQIAEVARRQSQCVSIG